MTRYLTEHSLSGHRVETWRKASTAAAAAQDAAEAVERGLWVKDAGIGTSLTGRYERFIVMRGATRAIGSIRVYVDKA